MLTLFSYGVPFPDQLNLKISWKQSQKYVLNKFLDNEKQEVLSLSFGLTS